MGAAPVDGLGAGPRVMMLGADGSERRAVGSRMESLGFEVEWEEALHCALDLHQDEDYDAWVILCDSGEGDRLLEAVERLVDLSPRTPVVVIAAPEDASWAIRALSLGANYAIPCDGFGTHLELVGRICSDLIELARLRESRDTRSGSPKASPVAEGIEQILSSMAHDVRAPIGVATGFAQRLASRLARDDADAELLDMVERIRKNGQHAMSVLARWRAVASIACGLRVPEARAFKLLPEMSLIAEIACDQTGRGLGDVVVSVAESAAVEVVSDQQQIRDICVHLVDNALRHGGGGKVEVRISAVRDREDSARFEFCFADSGPGVPPEHHEAVFEPGHRLVVTRDDQLPGPGLGLTIARALARGLGGDVKVRSRQSGQGALFVLELRMQLAKPHR